MEKYDVITFGEALIRYTPFLQFTRLENSDIFRAELGGAEVNVAAALSNIAKRKTAIITKLPSHAIGDWVEHHMLSYNISTDMIVRDSANTAHMGTYHYEAAKQPRSSSVVYDRFNSSFSKSVIEEYTINFSSARIFHTTGITLALSETVRQTTIEMIKKFRDNKTFISFDVNYRANLWDESTARKTIESILPYIDILFVSEETLRRMFARKDSMQSILKEWASKYNISWIASPQRTVINSSNHEFTSIIYDTAKNKFYTEEPYDISVVDRIGSGDAYISGVLMGLLESDFDAQVAMEYGNALAALKCTIPGDIVTGSMYEIQKIIKAHKKPTKFENLNR